MNQMREFEKDLSVIGHMQVIENEINGFQTVINRHPRGHINGYVKVDSILPEEVLSSIEDMIDVHGGITYQGSLSELGFDGHWIGFDTNHYDDWSLLGGFSGQTYKNYKFVLNEVTSVTEQLKKIVGGSNNEL